ncbi:glycosyltransferase family 2 protein [Providencia huaxiensis]|uniref:glycosyltransferase family 2 protein n=1 Tax=Providencia huaxiensis TaxID=2027290 RepID=UPI0034E5ED18
MSENKKYKIAIFTPSFNRKHTLTRCYNSITAQVSNFFSLEWFLIDDGSTDGTNELLDQFIAENKIKINYHYQPNSGKQAAWNKAIALSLEHDFFIGLDSDDIFIDGALVKLIEYLNIVYNDDSLIGLRCQAVRESTNTVDSKFLSNTTTVESWFNEIRNGQYGERIDVFKPKIINNFLFPVNENIKFIPESWLYCNISKEYKFLYVNIPVSKFFDLHDHIRLSKASKSKHATGQIIARKAIIKNTPIKILILRPKFLLKNIFRIIECYFYLLMRK